MERTKTFNFRISDYLESDDLPYLVDERIIRLLKKTFTEVNKKKKNLEKELLGYIEEYPEIPQFKNRLSSYYQLTGREKKRRK